MITNLPLEPDEPITESCGACTKCIDACPTDALVGPGQLNSSRCISFVTQTKGMLTDEFMRKIGNRLYGCDTCQTVCPVNRGKNWTHQPELQPDHELVKPLLLPLLTIGNKEFKEKYGNTSSAWRGKKPIQRNAIIGLGNFKDASAVPELVQVMEKDSRPVIRGTAAWALSRIGGEMAELALRSAAVKETDEEARAAMIQAIKVLEAPVENSQKEHSEVEGKGTRP
ncbi:Epoxyqueuosine reductase [compost metagenome]